MRQLADLVARQAAEMETWQTGELYVLELVFRERLEALGVAPSANIGAALMAVAYLLAERAPEWGGDARGTLGDVAILGLRLLDDELS